MFSWFLQIGKHVGHRMAKMACVIGSRAHSNSKGGRKRRVDDVHYEGVGVSPELAIAVCGSESVWLHEPSFFPKQCGHTEGFFG